MLNICEIEPDDEALGIIQMLASKVLELKVKEQSDINKFIIELAAARDLNIDSEDAWAPWVGGPKRTALDALANELAKYLIEHEQFDLALDLLDTFHVMKTTCDLLIYELSLMAHVVRPRPAFLNRMLERGWDADYLVPMAAQDISGELLRICFDKLNVCKFIWRFF